MQTILNYGGVKKIRFCDDCGSIVVGKKGVPTCRGCGRVFDDIDRRNYISTKKLKKKEQIVSLNKIKEWKNENLGSAIKDFECPKCKGSKATIKTQQTRSADEGMTHFIVCLNCGKTTRVGS